MMFGKRNSVLRRSSLRGCGGTSGFLDGRENPPSERAGGQDTAAAGRAMTPELRPRIALLRASVAILRQRIRARRRRTTLLPPRLAILRPWIAFPRQRLAILPPWIAIPRPWIAFPRRRIAIPRRRLPIPPRSPPLLQRRPAFPRRAIAFLPPGTALSPRGPRARRRRLGAQRRRENLPADNAQASRSEAPRGRPLERGPPPRAPSRRRRAIAPQVPSCPLCPPPAALPAAPSTARQVDFEIVGEKSPRFSHRQSEGGGQAG